MKYKQNCHFTKSKTKFLKKKNVFLMTYFWELLFHNKEEKYVQVKPIRSQEKKKPKTERGTCDGSPAVLGVGV